MHRGSRLARAGARLSRALLAGVNPGLRSARAPGRLAAAAWPSAPAAGASGGAPPKPPARGSAATADGLLDLLGEEDEETRFKRGSPFDRGPGAARREGAAWEGGAGGARGAWGATGGGGGIGGGSGGRWRQGGGGGGGGGSGGWRPPRDDSAPPPWSPGGAPPSSSSSPSFSSSRQAALEDGPAPSVGDFLTLAPSALAALPRAAAERMASASARAESVASPYERGAYERDDKGVAFTRADVGARALPDGTGVSLAPSDEPGAPAARGGASSAPADGVVTQDVRPLAAWEAKTVLQALKDDADALEAPTMLAALARDGTLAPLDDDDAARLAALALPARGAPPAVLEHPAARAAIVLKATLVRRALRASYTREGIERFAAATLLQQGDADDVFNAQPSPFDARRGDAYGEGDDPLLDCACARAADSD